MLNHTAAQLKQHSVEQTKPEQTKPNWLDIAGTAVYPLVGEDAQDWVTRTRQDDQASRNLMLGDEIEA